MGYQNEIEQGIEYVTQCLDARVALRETLVQRSRAVIIQASKAIKAVHNAKGNSNAVKKEFEHLKKAYRDMVMSLEDCPFSEEVMASGLFINAEQEYAEAFIFHDLVFHNHIPDPKVLCKRPESYILGLCDAVGELRRYTLEALLNGNIERAKDTFEIMRTIYDAISVLNYPQAIVPLKPKQDTVRLIVERTMSDVLGKTYP